MPFNLISSFSPKGDQPKAITSLADGVSKFPMQTLLGVTGSGKTFSAAQVIQKVQMPTLVLVHNKTLAAQLFHELKGLFPNNAVEYFVSYFDYYQPESYLPQSDTYIEKDSKVNQKIEELRLRATTALMTRPDTIIVASISCIYGLGDPNAYRKLAVNLKVGDAFQRDDLLFKFVAIQYQRNDSAFDKGSLRVRGDVIDINPPYQDEIIRIELFGDNVENIILLDAHNMTVLQTKKEYTIFPARHFIAEEQATLRALQAIKQELQMQLPNLPPLESHRLKQRTLHDLEMIKELGYCNGIENYSRHFDGRDAGKPPFCLLDFFPKDFLLIVDESHVTLPQAHGMVKGDYTRKRALVDYGFRLPSAIDNRPLAFPELEKFFRHVIFTTATPSDYELKHSGQVVEQIIRPTGLVDPLITVHPKEGQMEHLKSKIQETIKKGNRVLVTTLTKRMAEDLADYFAAAEFKVRYLHSEIGTLERNEILRDLRAGEFDILVGINLLREGLDIPECGLVAILDADSEGFLRNDKSLIQTVGRAARNVDSQVLMYADSMTDSMRRAISETNRRREIQIAFNKKNNITPTTIVKPIPPKVSIPKAIIATPPSQIPKALKELEKKMEEAANNLEFELAIEYREQMKELKRMMEK